MSCVRREAWSQVSQKLTCRLPKMRKGLSSRRSFDTRSGVPERAGRYKLTFPRRGAQTAQLDDLRTRDRLKRRNARFPRWAPSPASTLPRRSDSQTIHTPEPSQQADSPSPRQQPRSPRSISLTRSDRTRTSSSTVGSGRRNQPTPAMRRRGFCTCVQRGTSPPLRGHGRVGSRRLTAPALSPGQPRDRGCSFRTLGARSGSRGQRSRRRPDGRSCVVAVAGSDSGDVSQSVPDRECRKARSYAVRLPDRRTAEAE